MVIMIEPKPVHFEAAHTLPQFCPRLHGHTYKVRVRVAGDLVDGALADWWAIRAIVKAAVAELDHRTLNSIVHNPTGERVALWIWDRVAADVERAHPGCRLVWLRLCEGHNAVELCR